MQFLNSSFYATYVLWLEGFTMDTHLNSKDFFTPSDFL